MKNELKIITGGLIIIIITLVVGFLFSVLLSEQIKNITIDRSEMVNSAFITSFANNYLTTRDFESENFDEKKDTFGTFFQEVKTEEMLRIKVWNKNGTIIFSDEKSLVGKNFGENMRFQKAIAGTITTEIKVPVDPEHISEIGYGQLMEIYVPIHLGLTEPVGVIELYYNMDAVNESVNQVNGLIILSVLIMTIVTISAIMIFSISTIHYSKKIIQQEKFSSIGKISSRLAHDIRNPLSIIQMTIENIKMMYDMDDSKQKQFDKIERSIDRITHQVEDVLDFVKGKPVELSKIKLSEIIVETIDSLQIPDNIKLIIPENDVELFCDKKQFSVAMNNLVLNSIQAIDGAGTIEITVEENNDGVVIQIKDSGKGIEKEKLKKVFEPLFTTKQEGTGLGLASVKSIVESHQGTISVTSTPTIFTITLPKNPKISEDS